MTSLRVYNSPRISLTHHCLFFTVSLSATLSALSFAFLGYFSVQARRSPVGGVFRSRSPSAHANDFILLLFFCDCSVIGYGWDKTPPTDYLDSEPNTAP